MPPIDFEKDLNAEQRAVALAPDGPLFVLAAAGTGKTRTLVYRVAHLVERGVEPRRILLLTFTNKAAREMMERARELVGEGVGGLWGGTFHHMANRILRRYGNAIGHPPDFTILDRDDSVSLLRACLNDLKLRSKEFPKPDVLLAIHSTAINSVKSLEDMAQARFEGHPVNVGDVLRVYARYAERKREQNAMDFDDLLVNGLKLFKDHSDILARFQEQFLYVLVDEYQDTNPIQAEWVDLIAARNRNLMVVGDDFQSIYSWRGADYRNIMTFPDRYADAHLYKLETNYRSVPEILEVANRCIAGNPLQFQKVLKAVRPAHRRPTLGLLHDGEHQARYVVEQIRRLRREGHACNDIAVLYRAHYHAMELQLALSRERLPYVVTSGVRFFEQAHIKDVCSLLRLLQNPADGLAFTRLMQMLPGVGEKTAEKIWRKMEGRVPLQEEESRRRLREVLPAAAGPIWTKLEPIATAYEAEDLKSDPGEIIFKFVKVFYDQHALDTFEDYERRLEDIQELITFVSGFESNDAFLSEVALISNLDAEGERLGQEVQDCVRLSTVHQAKGLEWGAVIVIWVSDGLFPSSRSMAEDGDDTEERRLFYVAVTRAKDELILCCPEVRRKPDGGVQPLLPSRFVREIPPHSLKMEKVGFL